MRIYLAGLCISMVGLQVASAQSALERWSVRTTGPTTVTIPSPTPAQAAIYQTPDGSWKPLAVQPQAKTATFSLCDGMGGQITVILNPPVWLALEDRTPPVIQALTCDGRAIPVTPEVDLGHVKQAPAIISLQVSDAESPVDVERARATLNGVLLPPAAVSASALHGDPRRRTLTIALRNVTPKSHALRVRIPDVAPAPNVAELTLRFNPGPLLLNGGFESVAPDGNPSHWQGDMWSVDANTRAELRVREGGHTGERCLELDGQDGSLNLVFYQRVPLSGERSYVVHGYYQANSAAGFLSMINTSTDENKQYLSSPMLEPTDQWAPFEWKFGTRPSEGYTLYLRNAGKGYVRYDDVTLEHVEPDR